MNSEFDPPASAPSSRGLLGSGTTGFAEQLNQQLFVDSPPGPTITGRRIAAGLGVALAGALIVLLRVGLTPPLHTVWAEDGTIFLSGSESHSLLDAVQGTYAGYLHLVPRLLAEIPAALPLSWAPAVMAVLGAFVVVLCAFMVWWASAGLLKDPVLRGTLAGMVVLLPVVGYESLANIAFVSWFMLFASFWILLWRPSTLPRATAAGAFLAATVMSSGLGLLLAPIALVRAMAIRDRRDFAITAAFAIGAIVQIIALLHGHPLPGETHPTYDDPTADVARWSSDLIPAYLQRVVGGLAFGYYPLSVLWLALSWVLIIILGIGFVVVVGVAVIRSSAPARLFSAIAITLSVAAFLVTGYYRDFAEAMLWQPGLHHTNEARHTILPVLLLLSVVLTQLTSRPPSLSATNWRRVRVAVLSAVALLAATGFYVGERFRSEVNWDAQLERGKAVCAATRATSVQLQVAPAGFGEMATIPCAELRAD